MQYIRMLPSAVLPFVFFAVLHVSAATVEVGCNGRAAIGPTLSGVKSGDVILAEGTCRENLLIPADVVGITLDGQGKTTIDALDALRAAVQVLGREVTIKGSTVTGGTFGIAFNRGATGTIDRNTVRNAAISGIEVSHNSFARIVNNTIERNQQLGIIILGSASVHIGIVGTDTRSQHRMSSRTTAGMASRCCAPQPRVSSATLSAETAATA